MQAIVKRSNIESLFHHFVHPHTGESIDLSCFLKDLQIHDGTITYILEDSSDTIKYIAEIQPFLDQAIQKVPGVKKVSGILTHHRAASRTPTRERIQPSSVKHVIAIASGKGGVGKSTVSINLSVSLAKQGFKIGLLDADIYGPSVPHLIGMHTKPEVDDNKKIRPIQWNDISCMSIGFMIPEDVAMVWRGPMIQGALHQMIKDVLWPKLDILIIDMPPGTGDAHLTICQSLTLSGAVIVSTPQDLALIDARRAIEMYRKMNVPILGIIENMSSFICPACSYETPIFDTGGAEKQAAALRLPFLGHLPLNMDVRVHSDQGSPLSSIPSHPVSKIFNQISLNILREAKLI